MADMPLIPFLGLPIISYLLGSIPWGLIFSRRFSPVDIRRNGSGNIGATNVHRLAGTAPAVLTLTGDMLKGLIPVWLAVITAPDDWWGDLFASVVVLAAVIGHLYPIYLKFQEGGKGIATAAGCFLVITPLATTASILVFVLSVWISNRVSVGSLIGSILLPFAVWMTTCSTPFTGCAAITAALIVFRHSPNIKRLLSGTEHPFRNR